jgi:hypothetical protein
VRNCGTNVRITCFVATANRLPFATISCRRFQPLFGPQIRLLVAHDQIHVRAPCLRHHGSAGICANSSYAIELSFCPAIWWILAVFALRMAFHNQLSLANFPWVRALATSSHPCILRGNSASHCMNTCPICTSMPNLNAAHVATSVTVTETSSPVAVSY